VRQYSGQRHTGGLPEKPHGCDGEFGAGEPVRGSCLPPDVAMAEAAIGSGLATFIFLYAIRKTGYERG
jgi:hypothetical protein